MKASDEPEFLRVLQAVYDLYGRDFSEMVGTVWCEALKPFDLQAVRDALNRHAVNPDNGQFLPKPADVVRLIGGGTQDGALIAWSKVIRAVRTVGTYATVAFDDPIIHAVLHDMGGWPAVGAIDEKELPFRAKEFENRYRGYRTKGAIESYPLKLGGIADQGNTARGYAPQPVVLIGDHERARRVLEGVGTRLLQNA